jgi:hypothetical protein
MLLVMWKVPDGPSLTAGGCFVNFVMELASKGYRVVGVSFAVASTLVYRAQGV